MAQSDQVLKVDAAGRVWTTRERREEWRPLGARWTHCLRVSAGRASPSICRWSEEIIESEPGKASPAAWRCIGEKATEQLDYESARFFKRRIVRRKYVQREQPFAAPSSLSCRRCRSAALPHRDPSPRSWWVSIAIICRSTGRSRSSPPGMGSRSRGKRWHSGWAWPHTGCD